eukprot:3573001-Rhodomonas_salina.1
MAADAIANACMLLQASAPGRGVTMSSVCVCARDDGAEDLVLSNEMTAMVVKMILLMMTMTARMMSVLMMRLMMTGR